MGNPEKRKYQVKLTLEFDSVAGQRREAIIQMAHDKVQALVVDVTDVTDVTKPQLLSEVFDN